jgi:hypothetical protein
VRNALGQLLLAAFLLGGCEDNKLVTPPPAETPTQAPPTQAAPQAASAPEAPQPTPHQHGATGVGDTAPVPERAPPKAPNVPTASDWGRQGSMDAGTAADAGSAQPRLNDREEGARPGQRGTPSGEGKGPPHP